MGQSAASPAPAGSPTPPGASNTRLHGRRLVAVRLACAALLLFSLGSFAVLLPLYFAHLETLCSGHSCAYGQISPDALRTFQQIGLSLGAYAALRGTLTVVLAVLCFAVAAVLLWRKSDDWLALLVALMLVLLGVATVTGTYSLGNNMTLGVARFPAPLVNFLTRVSFFLVFSLFPNGRFVPRWSFWLVLADAVEEVSNNFLSGWPLNQTSWSGAVSLLIWFSTIGGLALTQVYRFRRVSTPLERQQTKWAVFGVALFIGAVIVSGLPGLFFSALDQPSSFYNAVRTPVFFFIALLLALSFAIAILRYRLWDIDTIINKALVYGSLTGLLGALYVGLITGLASLTGGIGGKQQQPIVLVMATLAIAALVQPARRRLQSVIDRRFYRRKYDAQKALGAFTATARNEVDLPQLCDQVLAVVQETMQPAHIWLWLRQPERRVVQSPLVLEPRESPATRLSGN